ncbi:MAG: hypothetical protein ACYCOU_03905 [Sulfobacillus sp.]
MLVLYICTMSIGETIGFNDKVRRVTAVHFGILSPQRILEQSVCEVYRPINYQDPSGTLADPRMGVVERNVPNPLSKLSSKYDPGYFGHIVLAKPVIQIQFFNQVIKTLKTVCYICSGLLVKLDRLEELRSKSGRNRFAFAADQKNRESTCPHCGAPQPNFTKDTKDVRRVVKITATLKAAKATKAPQTVAEPGKKSGPGEAKKLPTSIYFNPDMCLNVLKNISGRDCELLGYSPTMSRPDWMIWTVMPVPPPSMRPAVRQESGKLSEDHLTQKLNDIVKVNNDLKNLLEQQKETPAGGGLEKLNANIDKFWQLLQYHVATYIDNDVSNIPKATNKAGQQLKTLRQRMKAKNGRFRGNLMGKRVDYSGRTVVSPDVNISIDEVGIPQQIAMREDFPEVVTPWNYQFLRQLVANGANKYPGARRVFSRSASNYGTISLSIGGRADFPLSPGDVVYRHLLDGDLTLFNRQPSLHRMSMMAHRIRVFPNNLTFRLNVNVTEPYNADFDGDEMNIFLPRSLQTVYELQSLALVPKQIVSPQASKPVIGLVQDSLLGIYMMTKKNPEFDLRTGMRLAGWINDYSGTLPPCTTSGGMPSWTCHQLVNMVLPDISVSRKDVVISNGKLESGFLGKSMLGAKSNSLVHITWNDFGPERTRLMFDNFTNLTMQWLLVNGFSIGMSDSVLGNESAQVRIDQIIRDGLSKVSDMIAALRAGKYQAKQAKTPQAQFEQDVLRTLEETTTAVKTQTVENLPAENRIKQTVDSGSKGSDLNLLQIVEMLGQQEIEGSRVPDSYSRRPIPHFPKDVLTPESRGYVTHGFRAGLNPIEYVYHAMAGRIGVISTSIKTAETGYLQRKLIKCTEDVQSCYDGSVRASNDNIVQFCYGGDGMDAAHIESASFDYMSMDPEEFFAAYGYNDADLELLDVLALVPEKQRLREVLSREFRQLQEDRRTLRLTLFRLQIPEKIYVPVNFRRLVDSIASNFELSRRAYCEVSPVKVVESVSRLCQELQVNKNDPYLQGKATFVFSAMMRASLASKKIVAKKFTEDAFVLLLQEVRRHFHQALIAPGTMVGPIAAQSIGEPSTQMTLDTFHFTGIGSKANVSRGVPRVKEIISVTQKPKTPSVTVFLNPGYLRSLQEIRNVDEYKIAYLTLIQKVMSKLAFTVFGDLVARTEIIYDRNCDVRDHEMIQTYLQLVPEARNDDGPWIMRIEFDRQKMYDKSVHMSDVEIAVTEELMDSVSLIFSDDASENLIARIKPPHNVKDPVEYLKNLESNLRQLPIKGIHGIDKVFDRENIQDIFLPDGRVISRYDVDKDSPFAREKIQYVIDTIGTNLFDVLGMAEVDTTRTISNHLHEIYEVLGIEAARAAIIDEVNEVLKSAGAEVNQRHLEILADVMTNQGILVSVDRHGISKTDASGPLAQASFEETTTKLALAAIYADTDNMRGVSGNIMFGQFVKAGTNAFEVLLDEEVLAKNPVPESRLPAKSRAKLLEVNEGCGTEQLGFTFRL